MKLEITKGEGAATGYRTSWFSVLIFFGAWATGQLVGGLITWQVLDFYSLNPACWLTYVSDAGVFGILVLLATPILLFLFCFSDLSTTLLFLITASLQICMAILVDGAHWSFYLGIVIVAAVVYIKKRIPRKS